MAARGARAAAGDAGRPPSRSDNGTGIRGTAGGVSVRRKAEIQVFPKDSVGAPW